MQDDSQGNLAGSGDDARSADADAPRHNVLDEEAEDLARARDAVRDLWGILRGA